jgi:hypothetical protein
MGLSNISKSSPAFPSQKKIRKPSGFLPGGCWLLFTVSFPVACLANWQIETKGKDQWATGMGLILGLQHSQRKVSFESERVLNWNAWIGAQFTV